MNRSLFQANFLTNIRSSSEYYEDLQKRSKLRTLENLSIGDFGVAKYNEDDRWYRARVIAHGENEQISIVFIDFGNMGTIFNDEFYPLDRSFAELPAQAVACTLSEVTQHIETLFSMIISYCFLSSSGISSYQRRWQR